MEGSMQTPAMTQITIQDLVFDVPQPYKEGDVLNANEAAALNQTYAENLRNNFAPAIKKAREEVAKARNIELKDVKNEMLDQNALRAAFIEYEKEYEFGARRGGRMLDPVEREAISIATDIVKNALKAKNIKLNSVSDERMEKLVTDLIASKPDIMAEATRRVDALKAAISINIGDLDLSDQPVSTEGEAEDAVEGMNGEGGQPQAA